MSERKLEENRQLLEAWRLKIEMTNRHNIFCHCRVVAMNGLCLPGDIG
ncbi:MAG: hypothetical protein GDA43_10785 [Hormoscilla sp. SP5CHS1]|nr:hypothetical protein [Hormoscilla sp. SP12CHS1]MBC6453634.1 hypothetical protein [Hormoscilla sp. SP5CHS1]